MNIFRKVSPPPVPKKEMPCVQRRAGVLAPIFSLPCGDFGDSAFAFIDFLVRSDTTIWQVLPLSPPLMDGSPYQCASSFAINPAFLSHDRLLGDLGFAARASLEDRLKGRHLKCDVKSALKQFQEKERHWLPDYALFMAIKEQMGGGSWMTWPPSLRDRDSRALETFSKVHDDLIQDIVFEQFLLDRQWLEIVRAAHQQGVLLYGDLPIFVAGDSADVWANRDQFLLDSAGQPTVVAGVPPDYFSATGQRWGNPLFDWPKMEADGFSWWRARLKRQVDLFDWVRIDHFRGLAAYWSIPAECDTAMEGQWVPAPGAALLAALREDMDGRLPVIAEDLGVITEDVTQLRKDFGLPGMKILQFAFDSDDENPYLPANHEVDSVVCTGTHDNDTTLGWWLSLDASAQVRVREVLHELGLSDEERMPDALIRAAYMSIAQLVVIPIADWLGCDSSGRINTPGTATGNWIWQFSSSDLTDELAVRMAALGEENRR
ncbi:MAG: 4-alpha-glucanotransferase [Halothiobacillus sp.]|jgi:4-alpha-glucanotransferase|nr:4-alpha-glucanotransferase [Halothiobacillus sp.]